jgi:hypothetical protein
VAPIHGSVDRDRHVIRFGFQTKTIYWSKAARLPDHAIAWWLSSDHDSENTMNRLWVVKKDYGRTPVVFLGTRQEPMIKNSPASARSKSMNSIHQILETVVSGSLDSDVNSVEVNEKLQRIQDHLRGRNIPPVTTVREARSASILLNPSKYQFVIQISFSCRIL